MKKMTIKSVSLVLILSMLFLIMVSCVQRTEEEDESTKVDDPSPHVHEFQQKYNETSHYMECNCGEITNNEEHIFEWVIDDEASDTDCGLKHKECLCGYITEENSPIKDYLYGTVKVEDNLKYELFYYLKSQNGGFDLKERSAGDIITASKNGYDPLILEFSEKDCYYVCVYYTDDHQYREEELNCLCCWEKYLWVGFESKEEITESCNGEEIIAAFQINKGISSISLLTGGSDLYAEHYVIYEPEFVEERNVAPVMSIDKYLFFLTDPEYKNENTLYFTSFTQSYKARNLRCIDILGELYLSEYFPIRYESSDGECGERDMKLYFGDYYNDLIAIMITDKYVEQADEKGVSLFLYFGLFDADDFIELITK